MRHALKKAKKRSRAENIFFFSLWIRNAVCNFFLQTASCTHPTASESHFFTSKVLFVLYLQIPHPASRVPPSRIHAGIFLSRIYAQGISFPSHLGTRESPHVGSAGVRDLASRKCLKKSSKVRAMSMIPCHLESINTRRLPLLPLLLLLPFHSPRLATPPHKPIQKPAHQAHTQRLSNIAGEVLVEISIN